MHLSILLDEAVPVSSFDDSTNANPEAFGSVDASPRRVCASSTPADMEAAYWRRSWVKWSLRARVDSSLWPKWVDGSVGRWVGG